MTTSMLGTASTTTAGVTASDAATDFSYFFNFSHIIYLSIYTRLSFVAFLSVLLIDYVARAYKRHARAAAYN